jgi:hypothetical protein
MRTILQERVVNIEVKETKQWNESIDLKSHEQKQANRFLDFLIEPSTSNETSQNLIDTDAKDIWPEIPNYTPNDPIGSNLLDQNDLPREHQFPTTQQAAFEEHFEYSSLFELNLKFVPLISSNLFEQMHKQREEPSAQATTSTKAQKFIVTHPNAESKTCLWRSENLFERLRNIFDKEKYDINQFVVVDKNEILVDFTNTNARLPNQVSLEYFIIERTLLFTIQFHFETKLFEYFATSKSNISIIIDRFITDNDIKSSSTDIYLCFFDEHGKTIDNVSIVDLTNRTDQLQNKIIPIKVTEEDTNTTMLCEVALRSKQGKQNLKILFSNLTSHSYMYRSRTNKFVSSDNTMATDQSMVEKLHSVDRFSCE